MKPCPSSGDACVYKIITIKGAGWVFSPSETLLSQPHQISQVQLGFDG